VVAVAIRELDFEASVDGDQLRLCGTANGRSAEQLEELIAQTHRALIEKRATVFNVDLREVALLSESCFDVFVMWIGLIQMLPPEQRYRLAFAIDPELAWQRRSVVTLSSVANDVVKLES
jgi:hypothetical protein